uniref:hypothetical protein n=1 Tax=Xenorhabdus beddingii TaxID=40578 RepID=UPI000A320F1A
MSSVANWAYTATATIWRQAGTDEWNKSTFHKPELFLCDYGGDAKRVMSGVSAEVVIKNIFWTEFSQAKQGDYVLLGE